MTTSGTATFNATIQQIVDAALRKLGQLGDDESAGLSLYSNAVIALNSLIKSWQALGIHVWTEEEAILFLQPGQAMYTLGGATTDNCVDANSYRQTTTTLAAAAAANSVTLTSVVGLAIGQKIGVLLVSGAMHWTTISNLVGAVATLTAVLPAAVNAGAIVVTYATTAAIIRPLKVPRARLLNLTSGLLTPLDKPLSRQEYMDLPNPLSQGVPSQFFYAPKLVSGLLYVWTLPVQAIYALRFTWYRPLYDATATTETADFPQEWIEPLTWALAQTLGPEFDVPPPRWQMVVTMAAATLDMVRSWDRESEDIQFGMDWSH